MLSKHVKTDSVPDERPQLTPANPIYKFNVNTPLPVRLLYHPMEESCRGVRLTWIRRPNNNRPAEQLSADVENSPLSDWYNKSMHLALLRSLFLSLCVYVVCQPAAEVSRSFPRQVKEHAICYKCSSCLPYNHPLCAPGRATAACFAILTFMFHLFRFPAETGRKLSHRWIKEKQLKVLCDDSGNAGIFVW